MSRRTVGLTLAVVGLIVGLLFALADAIGLGGSPGFGRSQIIGIVVGVVILIVGVVIFARSRPTPTQAAPPPREFGGS
jgi:peptidoglycan/LPS O-acetylase OafA/YrhL